jgi:hypothetical protein
MATLDWNADSSLFRFWFDIYCVSVKKLHCKFIDEVCEGNEYKLSILPTWISEITSESHHWIRNSNEVRLCICWSNNEFITTEQHNYRNYKNYLKYRLCLKELNLITFDQGHYFQLHITTLNFNEINTITNSKTLIFSQALWSCFFIRLKL